MTEVSIVICSRNRAQQLRRALDAVAQIRTRHEWEIVVVDNGSTDETPDVIAAARSTLPGLRSVVEPRRGSGAARDRGWRESRGRLVAMTDDDCYVTPDYVDNVLAAFADRPAAGCIGGRILLFDPSDAPVTIDPRETPVRLEPKRFLPAGSLHSANLSFLRTTLEKIGGVDPALGAGTPFPCEDVDAIAAILWLGQEAWFDPRPTVHHHHGRKAADIPQLKRGYDRGRGAYYAKYLLRRDSRASYVSGWLSEVFANGRPSSFAREVRSAWTYLRTKGRGYSVLMLVPIVLAGCLSLAGASVRALFRRAIRRAAKPASTFA